MAYKVNFEMLWTRQYYSNSANDIMTFNVLPLGLECLYCAPIIEKLYSNNVPSMRKYLELVPCQIAVFWPPIL